MYAGISRTSCLRVRVGSQEFLDRRRRNEAAADEPVRQQIGYPHRVVHVGLATWDVPDVLRVRQHELETLFQDMPDRFPVDAGGLHGNVCAGMRRQPVRQRQEAARGGREALDLLMGGRRNATCAGHDDVLVGVEPCAAGM
jgi:hypothetical protein